ncbi:unnamed protein product [Clavelina lepadiformis]|uniref:Uncharacterized protein n=1 Tax=Clavelina lepadiformis TaxID=159417 RepID=A0ABP0G4A2_CLALP
MKTREVTLLSAWSVLPSARSNDKSDYNLSLVERFIASLFEPAIGEGRYHWASKANLQFQNVHKENDLDQVLSSIDCFYPSMKFELGESFSSFLSTFESFCDSVGATAAGRKHVSMLSLPEEFKLEMECNGAEVGTMNYEELKSKAEEVACCSLRCNKAKQQLIQRTQALGETNRS